MFPYRVKYTESEYDIQNNDLLYKIDQHHQNTFDCFESFGKIKFENFKYLFCIMYKLHNLYFVMFVNFEKNWILGFLSLYILHV